MATIPSEILDSFYARLAESDAVDEATVKALRALFDSGKKLKADDFVEVLSGVAKERPE